jgi:hypothetical protein
MLGGNKGALSHLRSQNETNNFAVRLALALLHGLAVDVHRCSDIGIAHQFLLNLEWSHSLVQKTPEGMTEGVPTDVTYAAAHGCGPDMPLTRRHKICIGYALQSVNRLK